MEIKELYNNFQGYLQLNIPRIKWVFLFGIIFYAMFYSLQVKGYTKKSPSKVSSTVCGITLSLNCSFIFIMTLFGRKIRENHRFDLKPFGSYYYAFTEGNMEILLQIFINIAMYIPFGFLLPCCFKLFEKYWNIIYVAIGSSVIIELIQVVFKIGLFEVDDIISNTLGSVIGFLIYILYNKYQTYID